ncbi:hypothetical protein GCM10018963_13180 [Saccharothrix longispora]
MHLSAQGSKSSVRVTWSGLRALHDRSTPTWSALSGAGPAWGCRSSTRRPPRPGAGGNRSSASRATTRLEQSRLTGRVGCGTASPLHEEASAATFAEVAGVRG